MKRFVTAVMRHETNTFSPVPTPLSDFGRVGPTDGPARGSEALQAYRGTNNPVAAYIDLAAEEREEQIGSASCRARVGQYGWLSVGGVTLKKRQTNIIHG